MLLLPGPGAMPKRDARPRGERPRREARARSRVLRASGPRGKPKVEAGDRRTKLSAPTFLVGSAASDSSRSLAFSRLSRGARRRASRPPGGPRSDTQGQSTRGPRAKTPPRRSAAPPYGWEERSGPAQRGPASAQTEASWRRRRRRGEVGLGPPPPPPRAPLQPLLPRAPTASAVTSPRVAAPPSAPGSRRFYCVPRRPSPSPGSSPCAP